MRNTAGSVFTASFSFLLIALFPAFLSAQNIPPDTSEKQNYTDAAGALTDIPTAAPSLPPEEALYLHLITNPLSRRFTGGHSWHTAAARYTEWNRLPQEMKI